MKGILIGREVVRGGNSYNLSALKYVDQPSLVWFASEFEFTFPEKSFCFCNLIHASPVYILGVFDLYFYTFYEFLICTDNIDR